MADEKLIEAVRDFPCLWQLSTRAYKDIRAKENAWKIVADRVGEGYSVDDCSKKWKSLRDKFVREIKKVKKRKTGEEGPVYVSCWPLFNQMTFISDTIKHRTTSSNFVNDTDVETNEYNACSPSDADNSRSSLTTSEPVLNDSLDHSSKSDDTCISPPPHSSPATSTENLSSSILKRKRTRADEIDLLLVKSLNVLQEKKTKVSVNDEEGHFGQLVAATMRRFTPQQKAFAKLKVQHVLTEVEFPPGSTNVNHFSTSFMSLPYNN